MGKLAVIAIGGNSIIRPGEEGSIQQQWDTSQKTCQRIAQLVKPNPDSPQEDLRVVITHGNGPQVGNILLRSELSKNQLPTLPLDVCVADSQGGMGYMLQQLLDRELKKRKSRQKVSAMITQVLVDKNDTAFQKPSKPIGPFYTKKEAEFHRLQDHWNIKEDAGRGFRRVVASPKPLEIIELELIRNMIEMGYILIALGGGGIPVIETQPGIYSGCAAVIDKDLSSSLLASQLKADLFAITTGVEKVCLNFGKPNQQDINEMTLSQAKKYCDDGHFSPGSMLPKIQAGISYLENGGRTVIITAPEKLIAAYQGKTGTRIVQDSVTE